MKFDIWSVTNKELLREKIKSLKKFGMHPHKNSQVKDHQ